MDAGIFTQGYSDDVSSLVCGDFEIVIEDLMRKAIRIVEIWCEEKKLRVNPGKTKIILFSKRNSSGGEALGSFRVFSVNVPLTSMVKYLGVIFDCRLSWIVHLKDKINKAIGIFWMCRNAFGRNWGLSPKALWWIYTAVVRPIVCHGCVVWWPRVDVGTAQKALDSLQRLAGLCVRTCTIHYICTYQWQQR